MLAIGLAMWKGPCLLLENDANRLPRCNDSLPLGGRFAIVVVATNNNNAHCNDVQSSLKPYLDRSA